MTDVVIAGIGQTEVGEHWDIGLRELAFAAIRDAVNDAGGLKPQSLFVGNMLAPNLSNQAHLGVLLADYAGLLGIEAVTIEAAGASGGASFGEAAIQGCGRETAQDALIAAEKQTEMQRASSRDYFSTFHRHAQECDAAHGPDTCTANAYLSEPSLVICRS